ncbi:hypothetical protein FKN04_22940 [Bacillus glycinifermentans]|uniref:hypothetical protein n=1 Tax=Bacillus glycinifermentans TaxID=1664069 RepID=UPI00158154B2|nr:hypothetical protein [Bacillus glycinifermentans]NUJ19390.1 hypothetical protein [Bacillus glycinifermentans]
MLLKFFKKKEDKSQKKFFSYTIYKTDGLSIEATGVKESEEQLVNSLLNSLDYYKTIGVIDDDGKRVILKTDDIKEIVINGEIDY